MNTGTIKTTVFNSKTVVFLCLKFGTSAGYSNMVQISSFADGFKYIREVLHQGSLKQPVGDIGTIAKYTIKQVDFKMKKFIKK